MKIISGEGWKDHRTKRPPPSVRRSLKAPTAPLLFLRECQCLSTRRSYWYQQVYDLLEILILSLTEGQASEMPVSGDHSLTGIERDCVCGSCWYYHHSLQTLTRPEAALVRQSADPLIILDACINVATSGFDAGRNYFPAPTIKGLSTQERRCATKCFNQPRHLPHFDRRITI